jgi:hypothetical protein
MSNNECIHAWTPILAAAIISRDVRVGQGGTPPAYCTARSFRTFITPRLVRNNFFVGGVRNLPKGSSDEVAVGQNVGPNVAGPGIICC